MYTLIVTVVLHRNVGINGFSFIHHIVGEKLNFFTFGPPSLKKASIWPLAENFGDPCYRVIAPIAGAINETH